MVNKLLKNIIFVFTIFIVSFLSFFYNTNFVYAVDTTPPTVDLSYSKNPAGVGPRTITATYSESITSIPNISINQPGSADIANVDMTQNIPGSFWLPQQANISLNGVAYGNGLFVAVGGGVITSTDGVTWTTIPSAGSGYFSVNYLNGIFVATGGNLIKTSPDGITWTTQSTAAGNWFSAAYGNSTYIVVAVNGTTTQVMTSTDSITWTPRTAAAQGQWRYSTFGNGLFVAVDDNYYGRVMTSPDGITWTLRSCPNGSWDYVTYANNIFVAVGYNGNVMTSINGTTWTARVPAEANSWYSVVYGNGLFVALSQSGTNRVMTSLDGITWTAKAATQANTWTAIAYGNGLFVGVSSNDINGGNAKVMTSSDYSYSYIYTVNIADGSSYVDGQATVILSPVADSAGNVASEPTHNILTIETVAPTVDLTYSVGPVGVGTKTIIATYSEPIASIPNISINQPGTTDTSNIAMTIPVNAWATLEAPELNKWKFITFGNGLFVAIVDSGGVNRVMTSSDGVNWAARYVAFDYLKSFTFGNGLFVAVSYNQIITSPDGVTWTVRASSSLWAKITYGTVNGSGLFVGVPGTGNTNQILTSPDGVTWTVNAVAPVSQNWGAITYGNGLFVAAADYYYNQIMTSPDGINWTVRSSPVSIYYWDAISFGNGRFIVTNETNSTVITSTDGINWTLLNISSMYSVVYGNGMFVGVGFNKIKTSIDGITWMTVSAPEGNYWRSVTYGNGLFVAVSSDGGNRIMTSPDSGYTYNYTINQADGGAYVDGTAIVSLSAVEDLAGNTAINPTNNTFNIDTSGPIPTLSYSKNPAVLGINTITVTYNNDIIGTPNISINQPGTTDISNVLMTGSGRVWTYDYTVNQANGSTYVDGIAIVSLSSVTSLTGSPSRPPSNSSFTIDTTLPTVAFSYTSNPTKVGTEKITATFSEAISEVPVISVDQPGAVDILDVPMSNLGGITWTQRSSGGNTNTTWAMTYGNGLFVAVAPTGNIYGVRTSSDGVNWSTRSAAAAYQWSSIVYGSGLFVAVSSYSGQINNIMTSPDGITWTIRTGVEANNWNSVTYGNNLFVAVASSGTKRVMTSTNGITWISQTVAEANSWQSITYGNGLFVAVASYGTHRVMTSPNGINWTARTAAAANAWYSVVFGNNLFVAVNNTGSTSSQVMTSTDGINWTPRTALAATYGWYSLTYGNGIFIAGANSSGSGNKIMRSTDGINWVAQAASTSAYKLTGAAYGNGLFVTIDFQAIIFTSPATNTFSYDYTVNADDGDSYIDGIATISFSPVTDLAGNPINLTNNTFKIDTTNPDVSISYSNNPAGVGINTITATYSEIITSPPNISINQPGTTDIPSVAMTTPASVWTNRSASASEYWNSITYGNGLFVAVSRGGKAMSSPDGINWTTRTTVTNGWMSVIYGNNLFVVVASSGASRVMTSPNGITWTARSGIPVDSWVAVTYGNGLYVAVSSSGSGANQVMTSSDGITWTLRADAGAYWQAVTYGNGTFVAVGYWNYVMSSTDGINWTARTGVDNVYVWTSVTYGKGIFVAVNDYSKTMSSPDGITWTVSNTSGWFTSIVYGDGLFVGVVDYTNKVVTSPDGKIWTSKTAAAANGWRSVAYGNGLFVAVADTLGTSQVMTSQGSGGYYYNYTVNLANGSTYVDGTASVSLSAALDTAGNSSNSPTENTFEIDTSLPSVALTYSSNPAGVGENIVTATYSRSILGTPNISINQSGTTDISNVPMSGSGRIWTYSYIVHQANSGTYVDGTATVSLSSVTDTAGVTVSAPANSTFTIATGPQNLSTSVTLVSSVFDTTANSNSIGYNSIMWKGIFGGTGANEGKVRFQLAASSSPTGPWNYYGGNTCGSLDWFDSVGPEKPIELKGSSCLASWNNKRYYRYKIQICSNDCVTPGLYTPTVDEVIVNWSP